ncbi:Uncharacterized protein PHSC3_000666 [Chlamydiales bacterium STE3]|nr:Uncharacterized protein PHSC3_000666 [Chlamydiales bacterium STE3]
MSEIIHIGKIAPQQLFILRRINDNCYVWCLGKEEGDVETEIQAPTIEEALQVAKQSWKKEAFTFVPCGFRFTLPERDEHGINALFYQAARSLNSFNGVYFDEELGHNCIVHQIPLRIQKLIRGLSKNLPISSIDW